MPKIMLVEDDVNLREIYQARLLAEGYEIASAGDGEEALAVAVREKPDLIIADIMMPKISGFDMLDILRTTPETKDVRVIVMTALSQAEDKDRADKLGADLYLVKSQVTLEDVVAAAHKILEGSSASSSPKPIPQADPPSDPKPTNSGPVDVPDPNPAPAPEPPASDPTTDPTEPKEPAKQQASASAVSDSQAKMKAKIQEFISSIDPQSENKKPEAETSGGRKIIQPLDNPSPLKPDINALLAKEEEKERQSAAKQPITISVQSEEDPEPIANPEASPASEPTST